MQILKSLALSLSVLVPNTLALHHLPLFCMSNPPVALEAGTSNVSAIIDDPLNRRCEATIFFADPNFLPISYSFDSKCSGRKIHSFRMPVGAPNGEAHITWQCAGGAPSCTSAMVTGGRGDPSLPLQSQGDVGCISESVLTATTLATITRSSKTFVETIATLLTSITTDFKALTTTEPAGSDTTSPGTTTTSPTTTPTITPPTPPTTTPPTTTPPTTTSSTTSMAPTTTEPSNNSIDSADPAAGVGAQTTLATTTTDAQGGQPPAPPDATSPSDPLETFFTSTAPDRTTFLGTTAAVTAVVSTVTVMQTVTAPCSADI